MDYNFFLDKIVENPIKSKYSKYFIFNDINLYIILKIYNKKDNTIYVEHFLNESKIKLYGKKILLLFLNKIKEKYDKIIYVKLIANCIDNTIDNYNNDIFVTENNYIDIIKEKYPNAYILSNKYNNLDYKYYLNLYDNTDNLVNYYEKNYGFVRKYDKLLEKNPSCIKMIGNIQDILLYNK